MKKLKILLNSKNFYFILVVLTLVNLLIHIFFVNKKSVYNENENNFVCIINKYIISSDKLKISLNCREPIIGYYYFKSDEEKSIFNEFYHIGDILKINGKLEEISSNSNFNTFDYKKYSMIRDTFYYLKITDYEKVGVSNNLIYSIKKYLNSKIYDFKNYDYINALVLGNKDYLEKDMLNIYQKIGIIHLFSISGTHISIITLLVFFLLKKFNYFKYILLSMILIVYYFIVDSVSILRTLLFFFISTFDKIFKLNLNINKKIILVVCIMLFINPYYLYDIGFLFSITISVSLIFLNKKISYKKNYFKKSLYISYVSFLVSLPIAMYNYFEVNLLSIFYNVILVPIVSFILFPISLLTILFPFLDILLSVVIDFVESISLCFLNINSCIILAKPSIFFVFIYYILIFLILLNNKFLLLLLSLLIIHSNVNKIFIKNYVLVFDVGQGDSILIHHNNKNILIDTGGVMNYKSDENSKNSNYSIIKSEIIPTLKSFGINKIEALVLTHGDFDHMGEAINLVNNFKVEKVIFNCGEYNDLEKELIKVLNKKKITYYSCIKELNIDNNKLYFLNNKDYGNENDNSSVIYTELNKHKFLFMGDAGVEVEEDLIEKYNLKDIAVLKVGHHGSKTSSSEEFIDEINPKYSIISVGKNNRYGHPNKEVLDNLKESKIYRTDQDGSIMFKIKNNTLKMETCVP